MISRLTVLPAIAALAPAAAFAQPTQSTYDWRDWPPGAWHMMWGMGWGAWWWIVPLLMMLLMLALCAFVMMRMFAGAPRSRGAMEGGSALRILAERFARGEISKEEFEEKRAILGGKP